MSHLKELILLFLINIIIIACSKDLEIDTTTKANASPFSTYYFVIKNPTHQDYVMLKNYMNIYGPPVRYEAAVLLAGYYVKTHEYDKAVNLLTRYIEKIEGDLFLKIIGNMWLFASLELNNDDVQAKEIYDNLNKFKKLDEYNNALKAFCISLSEPVYVGNVNCLERLGGLYNSNNVKKISNKEKAEIIGDLQKRESKKIVGPMKILINKINTGVSLMNGALLALYALDLDFDVSTENSNNTKHSYVIDAVDNEFYLENEYKINFSWDFNNAVKDFYSYNYSQFRDVVAIVVKEDFYKSAEYLKNLFSKDRKHIVRTIIYTAYGFQEDLQGLFNKYGKNISIVTIGLEKDIIDFFPLIRFIFEYNAPLYAIIDCFSGLFLEKYYVDYFNYSNVYAFTDFITANNKLFYDRYKDFYNIKPNAEALIGYDIIQYISYIQGYISEEPEYLSGIVRVDEENDEVLRQLKYYYIRNGLLYHYEELDKLLNKDLK